MKRSAFVLFLLLALTGCGFPTPAESPPEKSPAFSETEYLPALDPLGELSTPAEVTEGREPSKTYDLPRIPPLGPIAEDDFPILAAELAEADAAFYGLQWDKALIRWGDSLAEFDWPWLTPQQILPRLYCLDLDYDFADELIVICHPGTGTGVSVDDLHVLEKNSDGTLTDYALPWEFFYGPLSEHLSVDTVNGRTYAILGAELVDITSLLPEEAGTIEGLCAGDIVHFLVKPEPEFIHDEVRFRGSAWLSGEGLSATLAYAAEIEAAVLYQDGAFTLTQIHLS